MVTDNRRSTIASDFRAIREDLGKLKTDAGTLAKDAYRAGCGSAVEAKGHLKDTLRAATIRGKLGLRLTRHHIGSRPATAVAVAFGAGLIAGLFLLGRRG
jgi:ElaB/YqjD/DUF883 family membrane-anchored ribosome-binding protein